MSEVLQQSKEKLINDLNQGIADSEEMLNLTAKEVGPTAVALRERMRERMNKAKVELSRLQQVTVEKAKAAGHATDEFVHENPWKSIGIAAGLGLVVGLLISRR